MALHDQSNDELYRRDVLPKPSNPTTKNNDTQRERQDSAFDATFVPRSVYHEVAGTIFLQRKQSCSVTAERPDVNSATEVCHKIDRGHEVLGTPGVGGRRPSYCPATGRASFASDEERIFLRRRSVSTPPNPLDRRDTSVFEGDGRDSSENPPEHLRTKRSLSEQSSNSPVSPGRSPSPSSEPPPSPPLDSKEWLVRNSVREEYLKIEKARMIRIVNETAQANSKRASMMKEAERMDQLSFCNSLIKRVEAVEKMEECISCDRWPYTIPHLDHLLRTRLNDNEALLPAYKQQELELRKLIHGRLNSIEEVGFLSQRNLSVEKNYLLTHLKARHADLTNTEDVWECYLDQQITQMKTGLRLQPAVGTLEEAEMRQLADPRELCADLAAIVAQFPRLADLVKEWQKVKFETFARPKELRDQLREAATTPLADPEYQQTVARTASPPTVTKPDVLPKATSIPYKTPGGRLIPTRQPLQPINIEGRTGKWLKRAPARPLTPPGELFFRTTANSNQIASAEAANIKEDAKAKDAARRKKFQRTPGRRRPVVFLLPSDSDSTDSDKALDPVPQIIKPRQFVESDVHSPKLAENVDPKPRQRRGRPSLGTVNELPEHMENAKTISSESSKSPPCPRLCPTPTEDSDEDLQGTRKWPELPPPKYERRQLAGRSIGPPEIMGRKEPTSTVHRVPSLSLMIDSMSSGRQGPQPQRPTYLQVPQAGLPMLTRRANGFAPTARPGICSPKSPPICPSVSPTAQVSPFPPGTPVNSPSPALSNDVTDEGPIPSRLVARLETEKSRRDTPRPQMMFGDGADDEAVSPTQKVAEWSVERDDVSVEEMSEDWLYEVD